MADQGTEPRYRSKYPRPKREDGRKQFLTYLPPELIKRIKSAAFDRDEDAYQFVERELKGALDRLKLAANGSVMTDLTDLSDEAGAADPAPDTVGTGRESS